MLNVIVAVGFSFLVSIVQHDVVVLGILVVLGLRLSVLSLP